MTRLFMTSAAVNVTLSLGGYAAVSPGLPLTTEAEAVIRYLAQGQARR